MGTPRSNADAANITANSLLAQINNTSGNIGGSANLAFNLSSTQLATQSDTSFTINNSNGGMIGVDAGMNVSAASISTVGSLFANILNFNSGAIGGSAAVSFTLTGDLTTSGDANFLIDNSSGGTIGGVGGVAWTLRSTWTRLTLLRILCWLRLITRAAPSSGTRTSTSI